MSGNTIFITGGGTGIGHGLAKAFHDLGNKVIVAGRRVEPLREAAAAHQGMIWRALDVRDPASIAEAADWLVMTHPEVNVLINNAGIMPGDATGGFMDDDRTVATVETNLLGPIRMTSALIEHLKTMPNPVVVNVTSGLAFTPLASAAVYSATKAALHSWTLSLRVRLRHTGVRVLELAPPWVATELAGGHGNPHAMALDDFIAEAMEKFVNDDDEILVDRVRALRNNPGPDEWAFVEQFNASAVG
jgi:uncharacterized oxidoreductase